MKLVTYSARGQASIGLLAESGVVDIPSGWRDGDPPLTMLELLGLWPTCVSELRRLTESADNVTPLDAAKLLAPIPRPPKVLALAGNYAEHIKEAGKALGLSESPRQTTVPRPFLMPATVVIGPGDEIPWPMYSKTIDYELELGVVIGKTAKCIDAECALDHVAGYTIVNDVSARSVTFAADRAKRPWDEFYDWLNGKWSDGFLPIGPYLLTADELGDPQNLAMTLKVNGQIRQDANTAQMIYSVADIVSFLSHIMTLEPGDLIATGTPAGVAMATGDFLQSGDQIECSIEKLGTLVNTLGPAPDAFYEPLA